MATTTTEKSETKADKANKVDTHATPPVTRA